MMVLTAANNKQGRKARDHNTSFRRRLQRMRRIAWLHCIERKARKESLLVSWVVPASTHNHSSFIVQHVWQLHEGFLRQIFNHFSLGFHFIHCNKTLKHEMCWKAADNIWFVFSAIYTASVTISTWWSCTLIGPNFTWISLWCQNPRQKLTGKPIRAEQDPGGLKLDFIGHHSTQDQWQVRIPLPPYMTIVPVYVTT